MARETSQTIRRWGDETFGNVLNLSTLVARARLEIEELEQAVGENDPDHIGAEAADVAILLHRLLGLIGKELDEEVDAKMSVNRARKWHPSGDGVGRHI